MIDWEDGVSNNTNPLLATATKRRLDVDANACYDVLGAISGLNVDDFLQRYTYVMVKPDAVSIKADTQTIEILGEHEFSLEYTCEFVFDKSNIRGLWKYDINEGELDLWKKVDTYLLGKTAKAMIFKLHRRCSVDASAFLNNLKGPTTFEGRKNWHLRSRLGAGEYERSFVHVPDNSTRFAREIFVLLGRDRLEHMASSILAEPPTGQKNPNGS